MYCDRKSDAWDLLSWGGEEERSRTLDLCTAHPQGENPIL